MSYIHLGGSKSPVGFCHLHKKTLSLRQMKKKECLAKECHWLERYKDHHYWIERAKRKELAKARRMEKK